MYLLNFINRWTIIIFLFALARFSTADHMISYHIERPRSKIAERGVNSLYKISMTSIDKFLPEKLFVYLRSSRGLMHWRLVPGKTFMWFARHLSFVRDPIVRHTQPKSLFGTLSENVPYNYVILNDKMVFTEAPFDPNREQWKDTLTKHYMIAGLRGTVRFSGEFRVYKNPENREIFAVFDNSSGTYRPSVELLPDLKYLLENNFGAEEDGFYILTKSRRHTIDVPRLFAHDIKPFVAL